MSDNTKRLRNHVASYGYLSSHRQNCLDVCDEVDRLTLEHGDMNEANVRYEKQIEFLTKLLTDIKNDLDERAKMNDWAKVEDPELFFSTLGHTEDGGFVVALGSTNYWRLCEALKPRCDHPVHSNPGLIVPCPECGADEADETHATQELGG